MPDPILRERTSQRKAGEKFNPSRRACGFWPPDVIARQRDLTDGQKRLYERMVRWSGQNGSCWYSFAAMAEALGKSTRQVKADMGALESYGLISHVRRRRQSNRYLFLWHSIFEVQSTAHQGSILKVQDSILEVQDSVKKAVLEVQSTAQESCNSSLILVREISSSETPPSVQELITTTETTDDDSLSSSEKNKTDQQAAGARPNLEDREAVVETARRQLKLARAAALNSVGVISPETLARVRPPDTEITSRILQVFSDYADFESWLKETVVRKLAQKAKSSRYGIYLSDARNEAENVAAKRQAEEERQNAARIQAEIARERQQAKEAAAAAAAAELDTPMAAVQAYGRIQVRMKGRGVPRPLKARLERTGELISPNELERQILNWKRCPDCHDGTLGNAIDKTLAFCGCPAGIELSYSKGADWPAQEITRVNRQASKPAPARPPMTQADVERELAKRLQPPRMEPGKAVQPSTFGHRSGGVRFVPVELQPTDLPMVMPVPRTHER